MAPATRIHCAAVGDAPGSVRFKTEGNHSESFMVATGSEGGTEVPIVTVDSTVPAEEDVLMFKTDTQGYEAPVLRGATRLLSRKQARIVIIELSHSLLERAGSSTNEVMDMVYDAGYICTFFAFHTLLDAQTYKYGIVDAPDSTAGRATLGLDELAGALKSGLGPLGKAGWTDLMCWPAVA